MSEPLLLTKLFIPPPRTGIVSRPHLMEKINKGQAAGRKLTLISAPAGFGKTSLIGEWVANSGRQVAWLSLDEGDSNLARFISYLVAALQTIQAGMGQELLVALHASQTQLPPTETILTALLNQIAAYRENIVLVLDDYHVIDSQPVDTARSVDAALAFLIEHMPPQMHLVVASREDPHLPLSKYRARGQLVELRAADLRFSTSEAAEFLNQMMGLNLSEEDIAALDRRTEGWIAGLQLAAVSMQGNPDAGSFIKSFTGSHRFVLDYLLEEVLHRQPAEIQTFLLRTSILDRLCGALCDAVLLDPSTSGQETLEYLEHANLFLVSLDNERHWFRYHHLFADLLRQRLLQQPRAPRNSSLSGWEANGGTADRPDAPTLHRRASEWYERNGLAAEAIHHTLAAQDFERAATLIELAAPEIRKNRQETTRTELAWLKALPDELVRFRPVLSVAYAYALFGGGEVEAVESRLRDAERWLDTTAELGGRPKSSPAEMVVVDEKEFRRLPGMIALLRTARALARGDMPETVKNAQRVLDLAPEDDHLILGGAESTLGLSAWASGDLDSARRLTADGIENVRRAGYTSPAIGGAITLADILIVQGRLGEAMTIYERGLQWATEPGAPVLRGAADMHVGMSSLYYEHNDLQKATQHLLTSQALGELAGLPQNPYRWCAAMARIREAQDDMEGALNLLDQAERLYNANFSPNVRPLAARKTRLWLAQGQLDEALGWVRAQSLSVDDDLSYLREFDHITLARVLLACHQRDPGGHSLHEAVVLLERLLQAAQAGGRTGSLVEILVLLALARQLQEDLPAALTPLQEALSLAEPEGYARMFLDEGPNMLRLVRKAAQRGIMPDYSGKLLSAFRELEAESPPRLDLPAAEPLFETKGLSTKTMLVEPLSQREMEILKLIAQGLSNRQISERLYLALDTVKGHNRKIFDKLQVQSRTEAIVRARELDLL